MTELPPDFPNDSRTGERLTPSGERALESIVNAGFAGETGESWSPEGRRIIRLLSLLDQSKSETDGSRSLLIDVTMARVLRASERDLAGRIHPKNAPEALTPESARSVDELVRYGWRERSEAASGAAALLSLLDADAQTGSARSHLVESTLAGVQRQIESARSRFRLSPDRSLGSPRGGFRLTDLAAAAAAILLAGSL
ncbi:MAG: hypothetical protein JNK58_03970, partial [Phycisphaerae bacterium]|nr:hypothetical protein [Phycisphaerae bacterium]